MSNATDPNWWAIGLLLGVCGWNILGIYLMVWRQPSDETFLIAMILWASAPFWVWFTPFSQSLRQVVIGFWHGMD
ncbi:hypothetical protein LCGC14_2696470 [marine sediment metagenome]|uniref:Uncharacterized protein n=1 Tax=marine sediment metagenome TaxID=412755 RepID=A0A0F9A4J1_9ZZZZ